MLQSLKIENFKQFKCLSLPTLKRVNLIAGKNNTGKTALLEAILLLAEPVTFFTDFPLAFRPMGNMGDMRQNVWRWLFHNHNADPPIHLKADTEASKGYEIMVRVGGPLPSGFILKTSYDDMQSAIKGIWNPQNNTIREPYPQIGGAGILSDKPRSIQEVLPLYDRVVWKPGGEERLESMLRTFYPRLKSIRALEIHGARLLHADVGLDVRIPLTNIGQGFSRLLAIYSQIVASEKKILLIDEFESGLHYSVLIDVWRSVLKAVEQADVQVFATTHSYECIRAAHQAFAETMNYDFALHRLEEVDGGIKATSFDKDTLETALASNFEIR